MGNAFLLGFARAMQYPSKFQKICYGAQRFYGIPEKSIACELSILGMNNTPPIAQIKIIEPMVFANYPK